MESNLRPGGRGWQDEALAELDECLDIYIQKENPGKELESNWLPAYDGKFSLQARFYWPEPDSLNPLYVPPAVQKND